MKKYKFFCILIVIFIVCFISIVYSSFGTTGRISDIVATVALQDDLRITDITYSTATNSGSSNYAENSKHTILSSVNLPNESSTVTYTIELTNFGNVEKGIYDITGLPDNLTYEMSGYTMRDDVCDDSGSCTLGAIKELTITIGYASGGYTLSTTTYDINLIFDFRTFYTITWAKYNLITNLGDKASTTSFNMTYSITNDVITVTGNTDDGYGYTPYRVYLEAGKTYVFNMTSSGTYGTSHGSGTVEAFWMLNGTTSAGYYHMTSLSQYQFTPTVSGTYWLRLDVNKSGQTETFSNISIAEVISTTRVADQELLSDVSETVPEISKDGYTYIGYFDSSYRDSPFNYYADMYSDLYNEYGYDQEKLWIHYSTQGQGKRISQFLSTDNYTAGKSQILYGNLKPTTTYTITFDDNGGSGGPGSQTKTIDRNLTISSTEPTRTNYTFKGWGTSSTSTTVTYSPNSIYSSNASATLYAIWEIKKINFTINGDSYNATAGMTWSEWFTSSSNTTGETEETVQSITDSNGNTVELSAVIVDGMAYEVIFDNGMRTVTISGELTNYTGYVTIDGTSYTSAQTLEVPVGTVISLYVCFYDKYYGTDARIVINEEVVYDKGGYGNESGTNNYEYTVTKNVNIYLETKSYAGIIEVTEE